MLTTTFYPKVLIAQTLAWNEASHKSRTISAYVGFVNSEHFVSDISNQYFLKKDVFFIEIMNLSV